MRSAALCARHGCRLVGWPRSAMGCARPGCAWHMGRAEQASALLAWAAHASFGPLAQRGIEIPFLFSFSLNSNLKIYISLLEAPKIMKLILLDS
jgi:hypothetical protein